MEKYKKVRSERDAVPDGIIRVNRNIVARVFIDQVLDEFTNKGRESVTLSSLGEAITKSVTIAEVVKHRVAGLHQVNEISTIVIDDEYEPIEDGLDKMTVSRKLTCLQITLSKKAPADTSVAGYQEPIPESEVNAEAGPEDDGRRNARRSGPGGKRSSTQKPRATEEKKPEPAAEEAKAATPAPKEEGKKERARSNRSRRRPRAGSENRRGGRGAQAQAQAAGDKQDGGSYNPFAGKVQPKAEAAGADKEKPAGGDRQKSARRGGGERRRGGGQGGRARGGAQGAADATPKEQQ